MKLTIKTEGGDKAAPVKKNEKRKRWRSVIDDLGILSSQEADALG